MLSARLRFAIRCRVALNALRRLLSGSLWEVVKRREGVRKQHSALFSPERDRAAARRWRVAVEEQAYSFKFVSVAERHLMLYAGSFRLASQSTSLPEGGLAIRCRAAPFMPSLVREGGRRSLTDE